MTPVFGGALRLLVPARKHLFLIASAVTLASPLDATAQFGGDARLWAGGGFGMGFIQNGSRAAALHFTGHVAYQRGPHMLTARASEAAELFDEGLADLALLYGRSGGGASTHRSISAGLAVISSRVCPVFGSGDSCVNDTALGFPIVARASLEPNRWVGVGIEVSANVNSLNSYWAAAVSLRLGMVNRSTSARGAG